MTINSSAALLTRRELERLEAENAELRERLSRAESEASRQAARVSALEVESQTAKRELEFALWGGSLALWRMNLKTRQVQFSEGWYRVHHFERGAIVTDMDSLKQRVYPGDLPRVAQAHQDHFAGRSEHTEVEYRLLGGDGQWRWVHEQSYIVERNSAGEPLIVAGTHYEITARKQAEDASREHANRFQAFMDHLPSLVFIKDHEGRYLYGNRAWSAQFQRSPEELLNATDYELWPREVAEMFRASDRQLLDSGRIQQLEEATEAENARVFSVTKFPIVQSDGSMLLGGIATDVTERTRIERQLRDSEVRFRELAQSVGLIPWEWDCRQERYAYIGPQAERMLGYPLRAWQEPGFWQRAIHPDDRERTIGASERSVGEDYELEYRLIRADGATIWVHDIARVVREAGHSTKVRGYTMEVTERKLMELKLLESESRMRSLANNAPDTIILIDAEQRIEYVNRVPPEFAHLPFVGTHLLDWFPPAAQAASRQAIERTLREGHSGEYTVPTIDHGAGAHWYSVHMGPVTVKGEIQGAVLIARNIDEQRKVSEALRTSEERYRLLADHSTDMIALLSPELVVKYVSPACRTLLGYEPEEMLGRSAPDFLVAADIPNISHEFARFLKDNQMPATTCRLIRRDGSTAWVEPRAKVRYDAQTGAVLDIIASIRNVNEQVVANRRLREREAQLAHVARLSTLGEIATELAHEINQPLYAISNFSDACLANAGKLDNAGGEARADLLRWIGEMGLQARRAAETVRRFGRFARKGDFELSTFDLNDCVRDVIPLVDFDLKRHGIVFTLQACATPLSIRAERVLMEQVIMNLLRNAIEALESTPTAARRLALTTSLNGAGRIAFSLKDTGPGFTGDAARLFEAYVTTKPCGTGIGLAVCRTTIEGLGGRISARNNPDGGACFEFWLPVAPAHSP